MQRFRRAVLAGSYVSWLALSGFARHRMPPEISAAINARHWTTVPLPARAFTLTAHDGCFWAAGKDAMIVSSCDGGKTWKIRHWQKNGEWILHLAPAGNQYFYGFGVGNKMWRSRDGGLNWSTNGHSPIPVDHAAFDQFQDEILIYDGQFTFRFRHTKSWKKFKYLRPRKAAPSLQGAILNSTDAVILAGDHIFIATIDGGQHWQNVPVPPQTRIRQIAVKSGGYLASAISIRHSLPARTTLYSWNGLAWYPMPLNFIGDLQNCSEGDCLMDKGWMQWKRTSTGAWTAEGWHLAPEAPYQAQWAAVGPSICALNRKLECATGKPAPLATLTHTATKKTTHSPNIQKPNATSIANEGKIMEAHCIQCKPPIYTRDARLNNESGDVSMSVLVGADGKVHNLILLSTPYRALAQSALTAVWNWRFSPMRISGKAIPVRAVIKISTTITSE